MNPLHQGLTINNNNDDDIQSHPLFRVDNDTSSSSSSSSSAVVGGDTKRSKRVVHGMLVSSLFSSIFGTLVPGAVYRKQTLTFRSPVYANDLVLGMVTIKRLRKIGKNGGVLVTCDTIVTRNNNEIQCVVGEADVWLPTGHPREMEEDEDEDEEEKRANDI